MRARSIGGLLALAALLGACAPDRVVDLVVEPAQGPLSGYYRVQIETELRPTEVLVGEVHGYDLRHDGSTLSFTVQGNPEPGPVDVVLIDEEGSTRIPKGFEYLPPTAGFERLAAVGASLSQGVQGGVPTQHGQLHSPSRVVAELAGAYHPPPLLVEDLFPPITGADVTPAPECDTPGVADHITSAAIDVLVKLNDEERNRIGFYLGLVDPEIVPYNLAVGNSGVQTILHGPDPDDFAQQFLSKLVFDLDGDVGDPAPGSQLLLLEDLQPTVVMCADTYGNDLLQGKPIAEVQADLEALLERLAATGAQVFLSNIPRPTLLPGARADAEEDALADQYRAALDTEAAKYPNIHVVDMASEVEALVLTGLDVGDQHLTIEDFNGLLSTDGLHLTDVGYAMQADLFVDAINAAMGLDLPHADLQAVLAGDEHSPAALLEQGIDPDCLVP